MAHLRAASGTARILLVDDEPTLTELLAMAFASEGWETRGAADGSSAVDAAAQFQPDVVVLDMMLPDMDGIRVLRRLRTDVPGLPILFLTAKDAVEDRVRALTAGGDDYMTKPFSLSELIARLRVLLRRTGRLAAAPPSTIIVGDLVLDEYTRDVHRGGEPISLTATEFELLRYLMTNTRRVVGKSTILDRVWNFSFSGSANIVEIYISYLRKKVDEGRPPLIHTVRGIGYILESRD
ncbi:response regulator transcription factor [Actinoplanes sp. ATCC 53533]|uniref:response regulator transcription factor n=1 Tax=Actinoplanes sp. ATCC 53533 TaxID=1288362 RepID=UPI0018F72164|nr:response regulator transcription factor [Actinoplanes sp. ATCC 53533]